MVLSVSALVRASTGLPRPRGDGPRLPSELGMEKVSPPPTRGWSRNDSRDRLRIDVSPRPRGDGPDGVGAAASDFPSPPPTRGWSSGDVPGEPDRRVSPAHAGMVPSGSSPPPSSTRLPRPRGDGPALTGTLTDAVKSPPPTRGWSRHDPEHPGISNVSPAHAGMVRGIA